MQSASVRLVAFLCLLSTSAAFASSNEIKVPLKITLETGYRLNWAIANTALSSNSVGQGLFTNLPSMGLVVHVEYAWQVGGLDGKKPAVYISMPIAFQPLFDGNPSHPFAWILNYGVGIRHDLAVAKPVIPFLAYGLTMDQLFIPSAPKNAGHVVGHDTRLEFGLEFFGVDEARTVYDKRHFSPKFQLRLAGTYTSFPEFGRYESYHLMSLQLLLGVAFH